jgi:branched-chain amino acid transport system substrate-binding protein
MNRTIRGRAARAGIRALSAFAGLAMLAGAAWAADPYEVHVILPLTGGAAFVGQGQQKALVALQDVVNHDGGIGGRPLAFNFHDDQSSPQVTLQIAQGILPGKPPVILGSSIVAMCNAIAPMLKSGPVDYCLSPGVHPPAGSFVFSSSVSTHDMMEAVIRYFRLRGWTKIATLTSSDATGQDADKGLAEVLALPENASMKAVERQHFNQGDVSVSAQIERIKQAEPQALVAWTTGAAIATIFKGAIQAGLDIPVATTNGNQVYAQLVQYADFLPRELYIPSAAFVPHEGQFTLDPRVEAEQKVFYKALAAASVPVDNMASLAWDPGMIVVSLLRKLGTNATAASFRTALSELKGYAGVNGVYDFTAIPQRGVGVQQTVVTLWDKQAKAWKAVSAPSGTLLAAH